jgi:hypothetical protein
MLIVVILTVIMLIVIMLIVIMLIVAASSLQTFSDCLHKLKCIS